MFQGRPNIYHSPSSQSLGVGRQTSRSSVFQVQPMAWFGQIDMLENGRLQVVGGPYLDVHVMRRFLLAGGQNTIFES